MIKNLPAKQKTWVQSLGWEDALKKETSGANYISVNDSACMWVFCRQDMNLREEKGT